MNEIFKFSLYGFLKNLRFFEPFFILFLIDKGLSFLSIGFLFSFREIIKNIMEIPSGAIADLYGRKTSLVMSFLSYIFAFILFGITKTTYLLYLAMFFFAIGDAFRTGTHKAIIISYLEKNKILNMKTQIYGYTRSWSKIGSAVSVIIGTFIVITFKSYNTVFWFSIIPYIVGLINLYYYPSYLNFKVSNKFNIKKTLKHLYNSFINNFKNKVSRSLLSQSFIFTGTFETIKDYIQVFVKLQILAIPIFASISSKKNIAILIAITYFLIYIISSYASKNSYKILEKFKLKTSIRIFFSYVFLFLILTISAYFELYFITIITFLLLYVVQNIWRPILVSKFSDNVENCILATTLSIESQFYSIAVFIFSPIIGFIADSYGTSFIFLFCFIITLLYSLFFLFYNFLKNIKRIS